jgi:hypothetical protein
MNVAFLNRRAARPTALVDSCRAVDQGHVNNGHMSARRLEEE